MRKILIITALLVMTSSLHAQRYSMTGDLIIMPKHEVSLGYGIYPATDIDGTVSTFFGSKYDVDFKGKSLSGVLNFSYLYRISEKLCAGGLVSFSKIAGDIKDSGDDGSRTFYTIMPQAKYNWMQSRNITLYSRLALGAMILKFERSFNNDNQDDISDTRVAFMFQASPIGIELGRMVAGYLEAGFGATGIVQAGIRCRF